MNAHRSGASVIFAATLAASALAQQTWVTVEEARFSGSDTAAGDLFGSAVALDGVTLVAGAPHAGPNERGAAYVFTRVNGAWSQQAKLVATIGPVASFDHFGGAVAIAGDVIVVGAPEAESGGIDRGAAYVFRRSGAVWNAEASLLWPLPADNERFGASVCVADDTIAIGAPYRPGLGGLMGGVGVFTYAGTWSFRVRLSNAMWDDDDQLGRAVDIERLATTSYRLAGGTLTIGAVIYEGSGAAWSQLTELGSWDMQSVALSHPNAVVGHPYIDGPGTPGGRAYAFRKTGSAFVLDPTLYSSDPAIGDRFATSLALEGDVLVVGEPQDDTPGAIGRGKAQLMERTGSSWIARASIRASDGAGHDEFGSAVALAGAIVIVGAPRDDHAAGVDAGSVYALRIGSPSVTYCTASAPGSGCTPTMSGTGAPSASLATPFSIAASNIDGQRNGLLFYGASGPLAAPWGTSAYLCVKSPFQRTALQSSGGSAGACDGALTLDWSAFATANPGALGQPFAAGDEFYAQAWYRLPGTSNATHLSDALAFVLLP